MDKKNKKKAPKTVTVNVCNTVYPSITRNTKKLGWKITENMDKTLLFWYDNNVNVELCLTLQPWQFINHIPGTYSISRKIELARNFEKMQLLLPNIYNFHPKSFATPTQCLDLKRFMMNSSLKKRTFIIKPDCGAQGRGIYLIQDPYDVEEITETAIAQQYISPYLLNGHKFDLRIYVLVTSVEPLRIYRFNEGMARLCTEPYQKPRPENLDQIYRHLTNYSLNKRNDKFEQPKEKDSTEGFKRSYSSVINQIKESGVDVEKLQKSIDDLIVLTILCVQSFLAHNVKTSFRHSDNKSRCFEIMGFDIMFDKKLKPWILEVNHSPSLHCDSPFDKDLKDSLVFGAMKIMDINPHFKKIVQGMEKEATINRITGKQSESKNIVFNPDREYEISKTTGWELLFPVSNGDMELKSKYDMIYEIQKENCIGGSEENIATKMRKEAIQAKLKDTEMKEQGSKLKSLKSTDKSANDDKRNIVNQNLNEKIKMKNKEGLPQKASKTPKSVLLLRERNKLKLLAEEKRKARQNTFECHDADNPITLLSRNHPQVTIPHISVRNPLLELDF